MSGKQDKKANKNKSTQKSSNGPLATAYLILYNVVQTLGWSYLMYQTIEHLLFNQSNGKTSLYDKVSTTLIIFQNLAVLEIFHAALGLVPSSVQVTIQQISSRVIVVCGALMITKTPRESLGFILLLFAWGITEIIRYANYALNLINSVPYFLLWLRYTTFYVLYPIGVTGELLTLYCTHVESKTTEWRLGFMPNVNLFAYYPYIILGIMLLYIPLFPPMYYHMIKQRRKQLGGISTEKKTK